ncbi:D-alanyl-D-alanine carboxypeptidase family protein [Arthrobacter sp.]|uniref:D-alanyl-D-alanine carboxypeptidase family protein n=1 Tax=Arthrobacter sp. TaxID=1667 RepID=UPI003A92AE97
MKLAHRLSAATAALALVAGLGLGTAPARAVSLPAAAVATTNQAGRSLPGQAPASFPVVSTARTAAPRPPRNPRKIDVLVNKSHPLIPGNFTPRLVRVPGTSFRLQAPAASAYRKMVVAARRDGVRIRLNSAYRSHATQRSLMVTYTRAYGAAYARSVVAPAGTSEHQTGLAVDVGAPQGWMARHAATYGFILRYPKGQERTTGYRYEPWHYRYLGQAAARRYTASKARTLEAYYRATSRPAARKPATGTSAPAAGHSTRRTTANLNLRSGAGTRYRVLATVRRGSAVRLTGQRSGPWYQVKHGSRTGWMSSRYLR